MLLTVNWENIIMSNNKDTKLQFTELTSNDTAVHEDLYIEELLISSSEMPLGTAYCYTQLYYDHAIEELQKANALFLKTFS